MNPAVSSRFGRLFLPEVSDQAGALADISELLNHAAGRHWMELSLPADLVSLQLSQGDIDEVVEYAIGLLDNPEINWATKLSLYWMILHNADSRQVQPLLRFFSNNAGKFDEQQTFSSIASVSHYIARLSEKDAMMIGPLLAEYQVVETIRLFEKHPSSRVRESVHRKIIYFQKLSAGGV